MRRKAGGRVQEWTTNRHLDSTRTCIDPVLSLSINQAGQHVTGIIGARFVASSSEERREWEHGMNLCSQPLGILGEKSCIGGTLERMAEQETRHVHASQSRDKVEAPDLPVWSLFGGEL